VQLIKSLDASRPIDVCSGCQSQEAWWSLSDVQVRYGPFPFVLLLAFLMAKYDHLPRQARSHLSYRVKTTSHRTFTRTRSSRSR
jgi:hypothetical protein